MTIKQREETVHEWSTRLKLVYCEPSNPPVQDGQHASTSSTQRNGVAFVMVHGSCKAGTVRKAMNSAKEGGEALCINDDTPSDTEIKDVKSKNNFTIKKIKEKKSNTGTC